MKIALLGHGKMGRLIEETARRRNLETAAHFNRSQPFRADDETRRALTGVEVLIDFSSPEIVLENIRTAAALSINLVIGTTGWHDQLDEARELVRAGDIGLVYGSNFSLGVNLFYKLVQQAAGLFAAFESYDPFIEEAHHKMKKDAPSGTALTLTRLMAGHYGDRPVPVTSVRAGHIPGTHAVSFDSAVDTIRLEHTARNREGFAEGALLAASWIAGRKGCFEFQEVLENMMKGVSQWAS